MTEVTDTFRPATHNKISLTNDGALEVVFLGTGSAFANERFQSNIFIVKGATHLMIDLGSKASVALNNAGLSVLDINNLLVTHSHADHIGGIEELCLRSRYAHPARETMNPGEYRPNLLTTSDYASILWESSLRGGLEYSEETEPGKRLALSDYMNLFFGKFLPNYDRPTYSLSIGRGDDAIDLTVMRTNHIPDSSSGWQTAFYSIGVLIDNLVFVSGDTMFDPDLLKLFGTDAKVIFHDCQDFTGGVHASYEELKTLPAAFREKMFLYHLPDGIERLCDPQKDGFAGWTQAYHQGSYIFG